MSDGFALPRALRSVSNSRESILDYGNDVLWMVDGLCREVGGDLWFPERGGETKQAMAVCGRCPVKDVCLAYAIKNNETEGIWGGVSANKRRKTKRAAKKRAKVAA